MAKTPIANWPEVPDDVNPGQLDSEVRQQDLRTLNSDNADWVSGHLVMVARLIDEDPALAWRHAQAAVSRAGRVPAVREAAGLAAYRAGEFAKALTELRAARRMSGNDLQLPVMADCERGLGRPERALDIAGSREAAALPLAQRVEMRMVAAGARADLGQLDAAVVTLQCPELQRADTEWAPRLRYAYAEALLAVGRSDESAEWFRQAAEADDDGITDAEERWAQFYGVISTFVDESEGDESEGDESEGDESNDAAPHDAASQRPTDRRDQ